MGIMLLDIMYIMFQLPKMRVECGITYSITQVFQQVLHLDIAGGQLRVQPSTTVSSAISFMKTSIV